MSKSQPRPWREIAVPHEDVHKGTFQQAEFAADISRVHQGSATAEYQDPVLFFQRTYITEGMRLLLDSVLRRLAGKGGDPVIQLQTAFGGGKTHTMLAVMHATAGTVTADQLVGIPDILSAAGIDALPNARLAVLDGTRLAPNQSRKANGLELRTLWGELAWQLGGKEGYARVEESDSAGTSPGKDVLAELLRAAAPCVILIDELVAYIRQFEGSQALKGGTYDSNLSFIQALTEALKAVPDAVMLASLPESEREAGSDRGVAALRALEHYFGRVQAVWKPVAPQEAFEIVRRRLFSRLDDRAAADAVCRAFADHYISQANELPSETQEAQYLERMRLAYPIHPEVFERLYRDWSALPNFQRTRGVLKLMAKVIHRLWQDNNRDLMILPGSLPLYDGTVVAELLTYLPPGWDPVIEGDVDGERARPTDIEQRESRFGAVQACRRVARTIFLGSAPSGTSELARGLETERVVLGCLQPGQPAHIFRDALGRLEKSLNFLSHGNNRWWLDVKPTLRREMEERKRRFDDDHVSAAVKGAVQRLLGNGPFAGVHHFPASRDVSEDWGLKLVVLPLSAPWARSGPNPAVPAALDILRNRGEQPRQRQNRLLFLAADSDQVIHLKDVARTLLAWRSIVEDVDQNRIVLDNLQAAQARAARDQVGDGLLRTVREAFRWLVVPGQSIGRDGTPSEIEWEALPVNPAAQNLSNEIRKVATDSEALIFQWAPVHLNALLRQWFWKQDLHEASAVDVWQKSCAYLYFPRLAESSVLQSTIAAGASSRDFFGLAYGKGEDGYRGFTLGKVTSPVMDELLLIEPGAAERYETDVAQRNAATAAAAADGASAAGAETSQGQDGSALPADAQASTKQQPTRYFGTVELDPVKASLQFSTIVKEVVELFATKPGTRVRIKVDIEAESPSGFDETTVRAVRENSGTLGFKDREFD